MSSEKNEDRSFLGAGWSFPPAFVKRQAAGVATGEVRVVSEEEDIQQSLEILLSTRPGERVLQPNYGCHLDVLQFENLNTTIISYVRDLITKSILYFEPRIKLLDVIINQEHVAEGLILIEVQYEVRATNSRFNLVYPYYKDEADTLIREFYQSFPQLPA